MKIKALQTLLIAGAASAILSGAALAADPNDVSVPAPNDGDWDISFGVTLTSDYLSWGITQTNGGPAIQPEAEFTYQWLYLGWWGSNVSPISLGSAATWENDFSVGIRPEFGPVSFDIGHVWYTYNDPSSNGSEAYIQANYTPIDPVTLGAQFWVGTGANAGTNYTEVNASYEFIEDVSASAAFGWIGGPASTPYTTWNAGITWTPVEPLEIDVRYYYAPASVGGSSKVLVSASISSSLRSLGLIHH